jgi:general secretion pathway protein G
MRSKRVEGFTLIEIMIVVVIIGILASLIVPKVLDRPAQARVSVAKANINAISEALELYKFDNDLYPTQDQGLQALVTKPNLDPIPKRWRGYLNKVPKDPWGNEYYYIYPGEHGSYDIYCYIENKTNDSDENIIGNWDEETENAKQ